MPVPTGVLQHSGHSQLSHIKADGGGFIFLPPRVLAVSRAGEENQFGEAALCRLHLPAHSLETVPPFPELDCALWRRGVCSYGCGSSLSIVSIRHSPHSTFFSFTTESQKSTSHVRLFPCTPRSTSSCYELQFQVSFNSLEARCFGLDSLGGKNVKMLPEETGKAL